MTYIISKVEQIVRKALERIPGHGYDHTQRVLKIALKLAKNYGRCIDVEILILATLLHDIGRAYETQKKKHHALISIEVAKNILEELGYPKEKISKVIEAIEAHSYTLGSKAKTLEAMILSDADKLDALGAVGIARCFIEAGRRGRSLEDSVRHFREKLLKLKDLMYTKEAKEMALNRHKFMLLFIKELEKELRLER